MVLHNPNNWHWVNKDAAGWAREYLDKELLGLSAEADGVKARVDKILSMDGDVDVSQRKGKVITLFDVKLQLEYSGSTKDGEAASGTITIPEVAHDTEENEYVFDIDIYSESSAKQPVKDLVRSQLTPQLRAHLATLGPALIAGHTKDLQHAADHKIAVPPAKVYPPTSKTSGSTTSNGGTSTSGSVNITTVTDTEEFRTSAAELYATFTDVQRISAFTRAPPRVFEGAHVGGKFSLFDGNVEGSYSELSPSTKLVQKWRLRQWPEGHFSTLEITFDQNDVDGVSIMRVVWKGVPVGQEEVTKRNWRTYYVESIKRTFGFGTSL